MSKEEKSPMGFVQFRVIASKHIDKAVFLGQDLIVPEKDYEHLKNLKTTSEFIKYLKTQTDSKGEILSISVPDFNIITQRELLRKERKKVLNVLPDWERRYYEMIKYLT